MLLRRTLTALALTGALAAGLAGTAAPAGADGQIHRMSTVDARYYALGYLWSDGHPGRSAGDWHYGNRVKALADQFADAARTLGGRVDTGFHHGKYTVRVSRLPLAVDQNRLPGLLPGASAEHVREFVAAVIQGEGNPNGMVLDDPSPARGLAMRYALGLVGVRTTMTGTRYVRVYADAPDRAKFRTFPFLVWGRVPR